MCRVLSVKSSSYYDWNSRDISDQQIHRNHCELLVKAAHSGYGVDRLHAKLTEQGCDISLYMVRSIKEEHDIKCRRHKRFKVTTDSKHNKLVYPNVLDQKFDANRPNESWVSDITQYIELEYNEERLAKHCFAATQDKSCARSGARIQKSLGYRSPRQMWFDFYRQAA
ncbi:conserved hypothetical protein [Psychrobacter arcticus 273-4]|uniref:HTH-like domain-containing protein n=1 Tax=Psychrobacter arcticus (strain DSM 17307 / VKM B-2377 / 273-4) TaxID=259536 RepID=Q4FRR5_PSYA2|nr:conserved hypothetical protein [Psychrobacter arcticus 273-4]